MLSLASLKIFLHSSPQLSFLLSNTPSLNPTHVTAATAVDKPTQPIHNICLSAQSCDDCFLKQVEP